MELFKTITYAIFIIAFLLNLYFFHKADSKGDTHEMVYSGVCLILFYLFMVNA